jgi:hypothetical protein
VRVELGLGGKDGRQGQFAYYQTLRPVEMGHHKLLELDCAFVAAMSQKKEEARRSI